MSDIFISYKREDRPRAREVAKKFREHGFSVWWDRKIPPGKTFDQAIQEALDRAACVIVLWSERSVKSDWVKEEAEKGASRGILVPVLIDEVPIPLGFGRIQTANLVGWQGEISDPAFVQLTRTIEVMLGRRVESSEIFQDLQATISRVPPAGPKPHHVESRRWRPRGLRAALWVAAVLLSASTGAGVYSYVSQAGRGPTVPPEPRPAAASEHSDATAPTPPPAEPRAGAEPWSNADADAGPAVTEPGTAREIRVEPAAAVVPIAIDPNRQWLDADAAAQVLRSIASLEASRQAPETLPAQEPRDDLTILDQLSHWREFAETDPGSELSRRATEKIEELEQVVRSSATITAEDRFVTCERVTQGSSKPSGVREDFRPGLVYVFAQVNAPRPEETLTLQWLNGNGTVTRTQSMPVARNTAGGYRIFYAKQHSEPGRYEVRLSNESGRLIGRRTFNIRTSR